MMKIRILLTRLAPFALALAIAGCGGGEVYVEAPVVVAGPAVAQLNLVLTRIDRAAVQLDWSFDPAAAGYDVYRDGYLLAQTTSESLIDATGLPGNRYCYDVVGYDPGGRVVSQSPAVCIWLD